MTNKSKISKKEESIVVGNNFGTGSGKTLAILEYYIKHQVGQVNNKK